MPRWAELAEVGGRENVAQFAWFGLEGGPIPFEGFLIYPKVKDPYGNDVIGWHALDFGANWVITLIDSWVLRRTAEEVAPALWTPYIPVDSTPVPEKVLEGIQGAYKPLVFSKWGQQELLDAGVESMYIPLGVEPSAYRILPRDEVTNFRNTTLGGAEHVTVMVSANSAFPDRKAFQYALPAWAEFAKDKPNAVLYLHTEPTVADGGIDLVRLGESLGIEDKLRFPKWYQYRMGYPPKFLSLLYNAADVLLAPSRGEGFGIPIIEAQACGTPVVTTNFSSMPELVRWGHAVEPVARDRTFLNAWQVIPDVRGITDALQTEYAIAEGNGGRKDEKRRAETQDIIHAEYSWDVIVRDFWRPLAREIAEATGPAQGRPSAVRPIEVATRRKAAANGLHKLPTTKVEA
jgi:glycosyltransferase involved in cell wall biosynthesis